jgi:uncharacterized protein YdaU (DUF1376 family)
MSVTRMHSTIAGIIRKSNGGSGGDTPGDGSAQMARMPWYPRDFRSSTLGWPLCATGAYRALLDCQWDMESLPLGTQELRQMVAATSREWRKARPFIEPKFPVGADGRRRNARLESHRAKAVELLERQREGGRNRAAVMWKPKRDPQ